MSTTTRERIVAAAVEMTTSSGWAAVTMGRLADAAGVSRQTVYNEVGSKPALAETMILEELTRFLQVVEQAFDAEPDDLTRAIERAVTDVLTYASANKLLHAVVSATHGADTELLPLLTTNAGSLLGAAKEVITRTRGAVRPRDRRRAPRPGHRHGRARRAEPRHAAVRIARAHGRRHRLAGRSGPAGLSDGD